MTKRVITLCRKNRVTPSVTAPGDTNHSDTTEYSRLVYFLVIAMGSGSARAWAEISTSKFSVTVHARLTLDSKS